MGTSDSWAVLSADLPAALARVKQLTDTKPDLAAPYRSIYAACDALQALETRAAAGGADSKDAASACAARLRMERGLLLLQTDMLHEGEPMVADLLGGGRPWPLWVALRARNALGALWIDRDDSPLGLRHLEAARALYHAATAAGRAPGSGSGGEGESHAAAAAAEAEAGATPSAPAAAAAAVAEEEPSWAVPLLPADLAAAIQAEHTQTRER